MRRLAKIATLTALSTLQLSCGGAAQVSPSVQAQVETSAERSCFVTPRTTVRLPHEAVPLADHVRYAMLAVPIGEVALCGERVAIQLGDCAVLMVAEPAYETSPADFVESYANGIRGEDERALVAELASTDDKRQFVLFERGGAATRFAVWGEPLVAAERGCDERVSTTLAAALSTMRVAEERQRPTAIDVRGGKASCIG